MQLHLVVWETEVEMSSKVPFLHLVETTPSILRKVSGVVIREHTVGVQGELHVAGSCYSYKWVEEVPLM